MRIGDIDMNIDIDEGQDRFQEWFSTCRPANVFLRMHCCWCKTRWREMTRPERYPDMQKRAMVEDRSLGSPMKTDPRVECLST